MPVQSPPSPRDAPFPGRGRGRGPGPAGLLLAVFGLWTILGLLETGNAWLTSRIRDTGLPWRYALLFNMPWWLLWAPLTPVVVWLARRLPLSGGRWRRTLVPHVLAGLALSVVHLCAAGWLLFHTNPFQSFPGPASLTRNLFAGYLLLDIVTWLGILAGWHAVDYHRRFVTEERERLELAARAARLESQVSDARLAALRMQLNPHFLFNALHTVSALVRRDEGDSAVQTLSRLGDLLRTTLSEDPGPSVSLAHEITFLERYLAIEKERFRDRLSVEVAVPAELLDVEVPTLILQPLVENAIRHGVASRAGPGSLAVRASTVGEQLRLEVVDSGPGPEGATRDGVGLSNTRDRLREMYGSAASFHLGAHPEGGTRAVVTIPLNTSREHAFELADPSDSQTAPGHVEQSA